MGIATGTIIAASIAAGASVGSSAIKARAAGKAAKQQEAAATDATKLQRQLYDQQRADTMPWMRAGQGAVSTLANLSGMPMGGPGTGGIPGQMQPASSDPRARPPMSPNAPPPTGNVAVPRSLAQLGQGETGMIGLRGPDGSTRYVPQAQAGYYEQRGATRF